MGHHYVPQRYLRNFEDKSAPGSLWLYDKQQGAIRPAAIKSVAQAKNFYSAEVETRLAHEVEVPGSKVIDKLLARSPIDESERHLLATYIGVMHRRVTRMRRKAREMFPGYRDNLFAEYRAQFKALAEEPGADREAIDRRAAEFEAVYEEYCGKIPESLIADVCSPWPGEVIIDAIQSMTWRVMVTAGPQFFITCDNPTFYFEGIGMGRLQSEMTFPLSSTHALHGSHQGLPNFIHYVGVSQKHVRECNRRLVSTTERLAFYHARAGWLRDLLARPTLNLNRIEW